MLCGCANRVEPRATSTSRHVDELRHGFSDGGRLIVPSPPISLRHCFSVRVQPSPSTGAAARDPAAEASQSEESLGLGAEARPRTRSYTLSDGATSAIGRILTCFQDAEGSCDDLSRSRPRSRSLWSRRRSPVSCLPASPSGGCAVDVVLDCSPGTVRRRRLETQSVASTSSTLNNDAAWNPVRVTTQDSEASCEPTAASSERLFHLPDHPVWERRQIHRGRRRLTEPARQRPAVVQSQNTTATDIPLVRDNSVTPHDRSKPVASSKTAGDSTPSRRRVTKRATTCAIPHPRVRVIQTTTSGGDRLVNAGNEQENFVKPATSCPVSPWAAWL